MSVTEETSERRLRQFRKVIDVLLTRGVLVLPAEGWPGWSDEEREQAREDLGYVLGAIDAEIPLHVGREEDGTIRVQFEHSVN